MATSWPETTNAIKQNSHESAQTERKEQGIGNCIKELILTYF